MSVDVKILPKVTGKYFYKAIRFLVLYFALPLLLLSFIGIVLFNEKFIDFIEAF
jgi:hypothetical protein